MPKNSSQSLNAKDEQLLVSVRKTRQKTQLLIIQPEFISDIVKLRNKWHLPKKGLSSYEALCEWEKWFDEENSKYQTIDYPKFSQQHKKDSNYPNKLKVFSENAPNNKLRQDLSGLIKKFKLSPLWIEGLRGYLLRGFMPIPAGIIVEHSIDPETDIPILKLVLQEDTSIKDIMSIWSEIKKYQEQLPYWREGKSQPMPNFERNKRAYELKQDGMKVKEIAEQLHKELNTDFDYSQIGDFIKTYKRQLQKARTQS